MTTTSVPLNLHFSQLVLGTRVRTQYFGIEDLAQSILDSGLGEPIVLVATEDSLVFSVNMGGRRYKALELLLEQNLWDGILQHAASSFVGRPGFILKSETSTDELSNLITEIKENLDRCEVDWRDNLAAIVKAFRLAQRTEHLAQRELLPRDFGAMFNVPSVNVEIGNKIYDHFIAHPELYNDCQTLNQALAVRIRYTSNELARVVVHRLSARSLVTATGAPVLMEPVKVAGSAPSFRPVQSAPLPGASAVVDAAVSEQTIPLSSKLFNISAYDFLENLEPGSVDHVICDPDYALGTDSLNSGVNNRAGIMSAGVAQLDPEDSLRELYRLFPLVYRALPEHGYFIFWYAIDHHEKLQTALRATGFRTQVHPLIWNKQDFSGRSNAAPNHQFPKSTEFAMVAAKPGSILTKVQNSSVYTTTGGRVTKELNHAFAKPYDLWTWLYAAVAKPGQIVYDPFVGSGSSAIAALRYGLQILGTEIDPDIFADLTVNIQNEYRKLIGPNVKFS